MNIETTQPRCVAYVRVAAHANTRNTISDQREADRQLKALRKFAATRDLTIDEEITVIAANGTNAALDLPSRLSAGDTLLVTNLSRLGRGGAALDLLDQFRSLGVGVETPNGPVTEFEGYLLKTMVAYHAEERRAIALRAIRAKVEAGHHVGPVPFGYRAEVGADGRRTLAPDPVDAPRVRRAYDLYLEKGSVRSVHEYLSAETGETRTMGQTRRLLSNPAYKGAQAVGEARNEHSHPALVERGTWDGVQRLRAARRFVRPRCCAKARSTKTE